MSNVKSEIKTRQTENKGFGNGETCELYQCTAFYTKPYFTFITSLEHKKERDFFLSST